MVEPLDSFSFRPHWNPALRYIFNSFSNLIRSLHQSYIFNCLRTPINFLSIMLVIGSEFQFFYTFNVTSGFWLIYPLRITSDLIIIIYPHLGCNFRFMIYVPFETYEEVFNVPIVTFFDLCVKIRTGGPHIGDLDGITYIV